MGGSLDLHFDIAAMVIMVVILGMLSAKKNIPIKRSYVFIVMCIVQVLVIVCSMGMQICFTSDEYYSGSLSLIFADLYYALDFFTAFIFMYYMVLWSGRSIRTKRLTQVILFIPLIVYAVMIAGILIKTVYIFYTAVYTRQHDVIDFGAAEGHGAYIEYILLNKSLPKGDPREK